MSKYDKKAAELQRSVKDDEGDASITLKHYGHFVKGLEVDVNDYIEKVS
jgi:hypothetical protein